MKSSILLAAAVIVATAAPGAAQSPDFRWNGKIAEGETLEIRGVNGSIDATASPDAEAHVVASRKGRRDDPGSVRIEVVEHDDGVTICAIYPTPSGSRRANECRPGGGSNNVRDNDVKVEFTVQVPRGVKLAGVTVNGEIHASGVQSDVHATTVNGDVDVQTSGFANASSVNGDITCRLGDSRLSDDVEFQTVNGSITVEIPEGLNADFHATTVNGGIDSDFPIMVHGKMNPRSLRGSIGDGGPEMRLSTVNGSIRLRKI